LEPKKLAGRPLRLFLLIVGALVVVGGIAWWMTMPSLDPEEKVALDYVYHNYVQPDQSKAKSLMTKDNEELNDLGQLVKPGPVHIGKVNDGEYVKVVVFFDDPSMTIHGSRLEMSLAHEGGVWKVWRDEFKGKNMTFEFFQQDDDYQKVGISEWKEAELPY
jgi:hypothetical protein